MKYWAALGALAASAAAGAWVNGSLWETRYLDLQLIQTKAESARKDRNLETILANQEATQRAIEAWRTANERNEEAYEKLNSTVVSLRGTVSGLRGDFAGMPGFVRDASREALGHYASTCTAIFERMAGEVTSLGESGARIARQADKHAADVKLME